MAVQHPCLWLPGVLLGAQDAPSLVPAAASHVLGEKYISQSFEGWKPEVKVFTFSPDIYYRNKNKTLTRR